MKVCIFILLFSQERLGILKEFARIGLTYITRNGGKELNILRPSVHRPVIYN